MVLRFSSLLILLAAILVALSCSPASNTVTNGNTEIKLDPANMPPGLSGNSFTPDANTPGIPANGNPLPLDKRSNIPGITNTNSGNKPSGNSTPGIPDQETLKRQMEDPPRDVNGPPDTSSKNKRKGQ